MDFQMEYELDEQNERWNITLSGEIDIFNSPHLKTRLMERLTEHKAHLYLHCKGLMFIDSTALGALVSVMKTVKQNGHEIHLKDLKPNIIKLFRITNLDTVFILEEKENQDA
jgi:anti-sigma B factor antagonist